MKEIVSYECLEDALMFTIRASNKEIKEVSAALWPSDPIQTAYSRLIDALSIKKKQKLTMNEVIFIMHFCGRYDALYYMCDECLHERPQKKSIDTEEQDVKQMFEAMMSQSTKAYQQLMNMVNRREKIDKIKHGVVSFTDLERKIG